MGKPAPQVAVAPGPPCTFPSYICYGKSLFQSVQDKLSHFSDVKPLSLHRSTSLVFKAYCSNLVRLLEGEVREYLRKEAHLLKVSSHCDEV